MLAFCFWGTVAGAAETEDSLYIVRGVKVDRTADNAALARDMALQEAQAKAFHILARRLLSAADLETFTAPPPETVAALIRNFEIDSEKLSDVRYIAELTYMFEPDRVQQYFNEGGLHFSDVKRKPVLMLPFYQTERKTRLWEDPNPWREAWSVTDAREGLVPVVVPLGDISDVDQIPDASALSKTRAEMEPLIQRYNADSLMVAIARDEGTGLRIYLYEYFDTALQHTRTLSIDRDGMEDRDLFQKAVRMVVNQIQQDWKSRTAAEPAAENELIAVVRFGDVRDWVKIQSELEAIPLISGFNVLSLTPSNAQLNIHFRGDESRLRLALAQRDLALSAPLVAFDPSVLGTGQGSIITYELELRTP